MRRRATAPSPGRYQRITWAAMVAVAAAGALAVVGGLARFRDYAETDPRFCNSCHEVAPEIAIWTESEHRAIRCQQCHHNTMEDGLRILRVYVSGSPPAATHAPVSVESCAACHKSHDRRWPSIAESTGHRIHVDEARLACTTCHGRQMHFDRPARQSCLDCHADRGEGSTHEDVHCLACHNFVSSAEVIRPTRRDCLGCHANRERPIRVSETAPMQLACHACHRPHSDELVPCSQCHRQRDLAGLHALAGHADCLTCHEAHEWTTTREQCARCHEGLASHHVGEACAGCHSFEAGLGTGP